MWKIFNKKNGMTFYLEPAYSAESGHPFWRLTDTFLEKIFCLKLKKIFTHFSKFFSSILLLS